VTHLACYPYGAGHADEGVCLRLEMGHYRILLDCGLRTLADLVTLDDRVPLADWVTDRDVAQARPAFDVVICSHAHGDHARGLWALRQYFPDLPIYASDVTAQLLPLNWLDQDLRPRLAGPSLCQALPWRTPIELQPDLTVELIPAGHLPGAAAVLLTYTPATDRSVRVLYTGDCFLSNMRLVEGLRLEALRGLNLDLLIVEGSDGLARHPHRRQQENHLMERMAQAIAAGQSILLPVPMLGLGQELLFLLRSHHLFAGRGLDIWVHGAVATACDFYLELWLTFPTPVQNFARHQSLFWDTRVQPRTARLTLGQLEALRDRNFNGKSTIILTDSRADLGEFCRSGDWLVLLPESSHYQDEWLLSQPVADRPDRQTSRAADRQTSRAADRQTSRAIVTAETYWLSEHSDGNATLQLIHNLRPQYVLLVHGELEQLTEFTNLEELTHRYKVHIPMPGVMLELPIGRSVENMPSPESYHAGEVAETETGIALTLPLELTDDPRWLAFADTGIVETYWRGEELVIRGVSAAAIRGRGLLAAQRRCMNCQFYQSRSDRQFKCTNRSSPLFNLQVTPEGDCPSFAVKTD
jgi:Cft2 family RNA processing exonuclease